MKRALACFLFVLSISCLCIGCKDNNGTDEPTPTDVDLEYRLVSLDGISKGLKYEDSQLKPVIEISFSTAVNPSTVSDAVRFVDNKNQVVPIEITFKKNDSIIVITPTNRLEWMSRYTINVSLNLRSKSGSRLKSPFLINLSTAFNTSDKFPRISDEELLTLVQKQTFGYFWDFGHPTSGMARERSSSGNTVTTGGTGFGIMAMIVAVERQFVTRESAVERILKITRFLRNNCKRYHGAFPHWINGETGQTEPFSQKDDGADIVETSFLFQGLLTARQYFANDNSNENELRTLITELWNEIEWTWFQRDNENVLYWHWSPDYEWEMNHKIKGWNECLITYILAASSPTFPIEKQAYDEGWADNGRIKNNGVYYGYTLPLGESSGGPLFFAHYSFLGLNPNKLSDQYADYWEQNQHHTLINYNYCVANPKNYIGYSADCWGLTASDGSSGYLAHSPTNDNGDITPTAALSSMPYTPEESMKALHFFYYKMGDKLWKQYGFIDAFNITEKWYATDMLAIDQGPIIVMIENYRTGLLWNLFMDIPEIQTGLSTLGFTISNSR